MNGDGSAVVMWRSRVRERLRHRAIGACFATSCAVCAKVPVRFAAALEQVGANRIREWSACVLRCDLRRCDLRGYVLGH